MKIGSESVVAIAIALPVVLLAAYIIGRVARLLLRGRVQVSSSTTTVLSVLGISGGLLIAGLVSDVRPWSPLALLLALGVTMLMLSVFAALAARLQHPVPREPVLELIRRGESDRLEFKSSARWNLHTRSRDDRIEMVIAKAIAGFSNTEATAVTRGAARSCHRGMGSTLSEREPAHTQNAPATTKEFPNGTTQSCCGVPVRRYARFPASKHPSETHHQPL